MLIVKTFKKLKFAILVILLSGIISCNLLLHEKAMNPSGFSIRRGVNLSHWLSQDFGWGPKYTYINENDIRFIDSIGYDHVRIPIDEIEMWDGDGNPISEAFDCLSDCLDWCAKYKVRAIVDLHIIRSHHFNAQNGEGANTLWADTLAQKHLVNLWVQLSAKFCKYPTSMVAYEILNEAVAPTHDDWNKLMNKVVAAIRKAEPQRVLVIGANMWQFASNLQYLKLPEGDRNIILSFHTYTPMALTHYKADWVPLKYYKGPVHYPGQVITNADFVKYVDTTNSALMAQVAEAKEPFDKQRLAEVFKCGIEYAKSKNLQLYCGEFGCLPTIERKDRLRFYADMISAFQENNIAWCNWEYKGDFGIYFFDMRGKKSLRPDSELINILLNRN